MTEADQILARFHSALVIEIRKSRPDSPGKATFTVAEIYQNLVPYRSHRDIIGAQMNGDYENALLRLLGGEGGYLHLESEAARREIQNELRSSNPNTGIFREYAAAEVRLNPERLEASTPPPPPAPDRKGPPAPSSAESTPARAGSPTGAKADELPGKKKEVPATGSAPSGDRRETPVLPFERRARSPEETRLASCPGCSTELPDREGVHFCPLCGINLLVVDCSKCGAEMERAWRFCVACGASSSH